jgi:hypothetical protein
MKKHNVHKTFGPNAEAGELMVSTGGRSWYKQPTINTRAKVWVLRNSCLSKNNNFMTFDAKQQAKRFFGSHDGLRGKAGNRKAKSY